MLIHCKVLGTGGPDDPLRVPLPTYEMVTEPIQGGWVTVRVPDADYNPLQENPRPGDQEDTPQGLVIVKAQAIALTRVLDHLDDKYQEHRGQFTIHLP